VQPTETIADIKSQLACQPDSPPADAQRLLLKGKALADSKLLKDYNIKDGDVINLVVKPGFEWDPTGPPPIPVPPPRIDTAVPKDTTLLQGTQTHPNTAIRRHQRIPSVVLTPSHSPTREPIEIPLTLDNISTTSISEEELSTFHSTIALPDFWRRFRDFLR
jgi:hypothetical protein